MLKRSHFLDIMCLKSTSDMFRTQNFASSPFASWLRLVLMPSRQHRRYGMWTCDAVLIPTDGMPYISILMSALNLWFGFMQRKHNGIRPKNKRGYTQDSVWLERASQKSSSMYCLGMIHGDSFKCPKWLQTKNNMTFSKPMKTAMPCLRDLK